VLSTFVGAFPRAGEPRVAVALGLYLVLFTLAVFDVFLLVRTSRRGPDGLGLWPAALIRTGRRPRGRPELQRPVFTGSFFALLHPFALLAGAVSLAMLILHGAGSATLRLGEPIAKRAAAVGRAAAVIFVIAFVLAGAWVGGLEGARIIAGADPAAPSNPLDKQVLLIAGRGLRTIAPSRSYGCCPGSRC
jgi:hypothetical protein